MTYFMLLLLLDSFTAIIFFTHKLQKLSTATAQDLRTGSEKSSKYSFAPWISPPLVATHIIKHPSGDSPYKKLLTFFVAFCLVLGCQGVSWKWENEPHLTSVAFCERYLCFMLTWWTYSTWVQSFNREGEEEELPRITVCVWSCRAWSRASL